MPLICHKTQKVIFPSCERVKTFHEPVTTLQTQKTAPIHEIETDTALRNTENLIGINASSRKKSRETAGKVKDHGIHYMDQH